MSCELYFYSCDNERDVRSLHKLVSKAEEQSPYFHRIYPWRRECTPTRRMTISMNHDDDICGWLVYDVEKDDYGHSFAHVVEVATSNHHRGIGRKLMESLQDGSFDYITLVPLPEVEGFYHHLGFRPFVKPYWVKWVNIRNSKTKNLVRMLYLRQKRSEARSRRMELSRAFEEIEEEVDPDLRQTFSRAFAEEPDTLAYMFEMDGIDTVNQYLREREEE